MLLSLAKLLTVASWLSITPIGRAQPLDRAHDAHADPVARGIEQLPERSVFWIMDRTGNTPTYQTSVGTVYPTHSLLLFGATTKDAAFGVELADNTDTLNPSTLDRDMHRVVIRARVDPTIPAPKNAVREIIRLEGTVRLSNADLLNRDTGSGILFDVWRTSMQPEAPPSTSFVDGREDNVFIQNVLTHQRVFGNRFQAPYQAMVSIVGGLSWSRNTCVIREQHPIQWIFHETEPELPDRPFYSREAFKLESTNAPSRYSPTSPSRPESYPAWASAYHPYEREILHIEPLPSFNYLTQGVRLHGAPAAAPNGMPAAAPQAAVDAASWDRVKRKGAPDATGPMPLRAKVGA